MQAYKRKGKITTILILSIIILSSIRTEIVIGQTYHPRKTWSFYTTLPYYYEYQGETRTGKMTVQINSPLQIQDINNDGQLEFIFRTRSNSIDCFSINGTRIWHYYSYANDLSYPIVANLNNDSYSETLIIDNNDIMVLNHKGTIIWHTGYIPGFYVSSPLYICDLNNDSKKEIFTGSGYYNITYCLDNAGNILWNCTIQDYDGSYATSADLDLDGYHEILFGGGWSINGISNKFYCLNNNGTLRWEFTANGYVFYPPIAKDLNNDNLPEIVFYASVGKQLILYCLDATGSLIWKKEIPLINHHIECSDINNDDSLEILFTYYNKTERKSYLECLDNSGNELWNLSFNNVYDSEVLVSDIDNNSIQEILVSIKRTNFQGIYCLTNTSEIKWRYKTTNIWIEYWLPNFHLIDLNSDGFQEIIFTHYDIRKHYDEIVCLELYNLNYLNISLLPFYIISFGIVVVSTVITHINRRQRFP